MLHMKELLFKIRIIYQNKTSNPLSLAHLSLKIHFRCPSVRQLNARTFILGNQTQRVTVMWLQRKGMQSVGSLCADWCCPRTILCFCLVLVAASPV